MTLICMKRISNIAFFDDDWYYFFLDGMQDWVAISLPQLMGIIYLLKNLVLPFDNIIIIILIFIKQKCTCLQILFIESSSIFKNVYNHIVTNFTLFKILI